MLPWNNRRSGDKQKKLLLKENTAALREKNLLQREKYYCREKRFKTDISTNHGSKNSRTLHLLLSNSKTTHVWVTIYLLSLISLHLSNDYFSDVVWSMEMKSIKSCSMNFLLLANQTSTHKNPNINSQKVKKQLTDCMAFTPVLKSSMSRKSKKPGKQTHQQ